METKICTKCGIDKTIDNFRKEKRVKNGLQSRCKDCEKKYRLENAEKYKKYIREYYIKNKEEITEKNKKYRLNHKQEKKIQDKIYRENNKEKINKRILERKRKDPVYRLKCNIRGMIKNSFRRKGFKKKQKGEIIYGCSVNELIEHLIQTYEKNYKERWNWEYLKNVHVDHIIPLASAKTEEEVIKLCHYTNLQLLKEKDNLYKNDKLDWSINNE